LKQKGPGEARNSLAARPNVGEGEVLANKGNHLDEGECSS